MYFVKSLLRKVLPENTFVRSVAVLSSGTAGAQVLMLLAAPVLARLYTPEDFGLLAVFASVLSILSIVASLRYELAIPIADDDGVASHVVVLCLFTTVFMSLLTAVFVLLGGEWLVRVLNLSQLDNYLWLLPIGVILIGVYQALNYWAVREKAFTRISGTKITQSVTSLLVQLSCYKFGPLGLLAGYIVGQFAGTARLAKSFLANPHLPKTSAIDVKNAVIRYKRFPQFSTWSGLVNTSGHQFAPLVLAAFFGVGVAGWYALANRVVAMPATLIGGAVGNVFFAHAAQAKRDNELASLVEAVQAKLIALALPVTIIFFLVGPEIFAWIFGKEWRIAGELARWLVFSSFAGFLISSLSTLFSVLERQKLGLLLQIGLFVSRVTALVIGVMLQDLVQAIMLYALGGVFGYCIYLFAINICSGASAKKFLKALSTYFALSIMVCLPIIMLKLIDNVSEWVLVGVLSSLAMLVVYYFLLAKSFLYSK